MGEEERYRIAEIARLAGVTTRTVRYYVAEKLLPPPSGAGANRLYDEGHLRRLLAIRRLKASYLPLAEIRRRLEQASPAELATLAEPDAPDLSRDCASRIELPRAPTSAPAPLPVARLAREVPEGWQAVPDARYASADAGPTGRSDVQRSRSVWCRVSLAAGVELHYETSPGKERLAALEDVIRYARSRLEEGSPQHTQMGFRSSD